MKVKLFLIIGLLLLCPLAMAATEVLDHNDLTYDLGVVDAGSTYNWAMQMRWDTSDIPAGSTITSATLSLKVATEPGDNDITDCDILRITVAQAWDESSSADTLHAQTLSNETQGAFDPTTYTAGSRNTLVVTTQFSASWAASEATFNIRIRPLNGLGVQEVDNNTTLEFGNDAVGGANDNTVLFHSRTATNTADRPTLTIVYTPPAAAAGQIIIIE